jgi:hypothetical protein
MENTEIQVKTPKVKKTEDMKDYRKKYYDNNKERYSNYYNRRVLCECGAMVAQMNKSHHQASKIHERGLKAKNQQEAVPVDGNRVEYIMNQIDKFKKELENLPK